MCYNAITKFGIRILELDAKLVKSMMHVDYIVEAHREFKQEQEEQRYKSGMR
jgi:hypothetical protein